SINSTGRPATAARRRGEMAFERLRRGGRGRGRRYRHLWAGGNPLLPNQRAGCRGTATQAAATLFGMTNSEIAFHVEVGNRAEATAAAAARSRSSRGAAPASSRRKVASTVSGHALGHVRRQCCSQAVGGRAKDDLKWSAAGARPAAVEGDVERAERRVGGRAWGSLQCGAAASRRTGEVGGRGALLRPSGGTGSASRGDARSCSALGAGIPR